MENLATGVLELAGNAAHDNKKTRIIPLLTTCNDHHAVYDNKHLDSVSICLFIDHAIECTIITSVCI